MGSFLEALTQPEPKRSKREELLRLAMEIFALLGDEPDGVAPQKDGTGPEVYVAPRYSPSP